MKKSGRSTESKQSIEGTPEQAMSGEKNSKDLLSEKVHLFSPLTIKNVTLRNRIGVSPMCQYSSIDGFAEDWHLVHLGSRAVGGAALIVVEASGVEPRGRISPDDLGIYSDAHIEQLSRIAKFIERFGAVPAIQIAHAGRKASTLSPWKAASRHEKVVLSDADGGWEPVGPSPVPFAEGHRMPKELTVDEIHEVQNKFREAARRAREAGFKWLELHAAHGYLLNSFYSPLSNFRKDKYGGSFENRVRMVLETVRQLKDEWPAEYPLSVRISATDWVDGGWTVDDSCALAKLLKEEGVDVIDCSSGNVRGGDNIPFAPGFQVPLAEQVRRQARVRTAAVGLITESAQADEIIRKGHADIVLLARQMMRDPYWPYRAAQELGCAPETVLPRRYSYAI